MLRQFFHGINNRFHSFCSLSRNSTLLLPLRSISFKLKALQIKVNKFNTIGGDNDGAVVAVVVVTAAARLLLLLLLNFLFLFHFLLLLLLLLLLCHWLLLTCLR